MAIISTDLLINSHSRQAASALDLIVAACERRGIKLDKIYNAKNSDELEKFIKQIKTRPPQHLLVAGGDGTVSYLLSQMAGKATEVGLIPLGTTNNLARGLGLPAGIDDSVEVFSREKARPVDLGKVNSRRFANVAGIGISAKVAQNVKNSHKKRFGRLAYLFTGAKLLIKHQPFHVTVTDKDGELEFNFETHQLIVANGRYHASREIAEDASLDSQELIVFAIGGRSKISLVWRMLDFYLGAKRKVKHSSYLIARDIVISTSTPQPVELDGEVRFKTPLQMGVDPGAVMVRHPEHSAEER